MKVFSLQSTTSHIAFCSVPILPAWSGAPLGASISTCRWPEEGTRSKQANVVAINCFVAVEVGQKTNSQYSYRCLARKGRGSKEMRQIIPRVLLEEIGAQLYPSQISVMQSVLCCTNQQPLCCCNPCTPARPHQTKRSHSVAHHLKSDASVRDLCLLLHINLPRPPLDFFSGLCLTESIQPLPPTRGHLTCLCATKPNALFILPPTRRFPQAYLPRFTAVFCVVALTSRTSNPTARRQDFY